MHCGGWYVSFNAESVRLAHKCKLVKTLRGVKSKHGGLVIHHTGEPKHAALAFLVGNFVRTKSPTDVSDVFHY